MTTMRCWSLGMLALLMQVAPAPFGHETRSMRFESDEQSIHWQIEERRVERVAFLLAQGADANALDALGRPAIWVASAQPDAQMVKLLLAAGADPNARTADATTPLMWAASLGHEEVARTLLAAGAGPHAADKHGATALIWAADKRQLAMVRLLLAVGADPNVRTHDGRTALSSGRWQIVEQRVNGVDYFARGVRQTVNDPLVKALVDAGATE